MYRIEMSCRSVPLMLCLCILSVTLVAQDTRELLRTADLLYTETSYMAAQEKYLEALKAAEDAQNPLLIIKAQKGIANCHYYMRDKPNARKWLHKSLNMAQTFRQDSLLADIYYSTSLMFIETGKVDSAEYYANKAVALMQKAKQYGKLANMYAALSDIHLNVTQDFKKAEELIQLASTNANLADDNRARAFVNMKWYFLYSTLKKDYRTALQYINEAERLYLESGSREDVMYAINFKADCLARLGDTLAASYMHKWFAFKDSVFKSEKVASMAKYEKLYEVEKKEQENRLLQQENNLARIKLQSKNRLLALAVIVFLLIVLAGLWLNNRNNLIKKQQELVMLQNIQKDKERIARDLHDHVGGQLSYIVHSIDGIIDEEREKRAEVATSIHQSVRSVIASLRETIWAINESGISTQDFSDKLKVFARNLFKHSQTSIQFTEELGEQKELNALQGLNLYRICQEILTNTFKHARATEVKIHLARGGEKLVVTLEDNGIGFDRLEEKKEKYGLQNIIRRAEESGIALTLDTAPGKGTRYLMQV